MSWVLVTLAISLALSTFLGVVLFRLMMFHKTRADKWMSMYANLVLEIQEAGDRMLAQEPFAGPDDGSTAPPQTH